MERSEREIFRFVLLKGRKASLKYNSVFVLPEI